MAVVLEVTVDGAKTVTSTNSPILGSISPIPSGGTTGQALVKLSNTSGDYGWGTVSGGGGGGSGTVVSVNGQTPDGAGAVIITKTDIGLGNVPNVNTQDATNINTGLLAIGRIPTGSSSTTVALGNHGHAISDTTGLQTSLNAKAASGANSDITSLSGLTTPVSPVQGGTGSSIYNVGDILYATATSTLGKLAAGASGNALLSNGAGVAPSYGKIGLTTHVSGVLPAANGGTGQSTYTVGDILYATGATAVGKLAAAAAGNVLKSNGTGAAPVYGKVVLGTDTSGSLATSAITGLDAALADLAPLVHDHPFADITGSLGIGQFAAGMVVYVDKALADYGAAGTWPVSRPTSSTSVKVVWMGDTDPGSIALDRDIWYQTTT